MTDTVPAIRPPAEHVRAAAGQADPSRPADPGGDPRVVSLAAGSPALSRIARQCGAAVERLRAGYGDRRELAGVLGHAAEEAAALSLAASAAWSIVREAEEGLGVSPSDYPESLSGARAMADEQPKEFQGVQPTRDTAQEPSPVEKVASRTEPGEERPPSVPPQESNVNAIKSGREPEEYVAKENEATAAYQDDHPLEDEEEQDEGPDDEELDRLTRPDA